MTERKDTTISIWFFVGTLLTIYGVMILGADFYYQGHPRATEVVLSELRIGLWWGILLLVLGLVYSIKFRPGKG